MQPKLIVISGPDKGREFTLEEGQTLIVGRGESTATRLADPQVSRTHCQIEVDGGSFRLSDLKSRGGTSVNGRPISRHGLRPGDVIVIGGTELRFEIEGDTAAATVLGPIASTPKPAPGKVSFSSLVGRKIADYEIEAKLATGSSGVVFRARDTKHHRTVALKILWPETVATKEGVDRFVRAMKTMMPIHHPNIVQIYAAGKTGQHCWAAMEFVDGENLSQVIRRIGTAGMLDWRYAFRVAVHIARALQEAAKHDIIHRKITPSNILMSAVERRGGETPPDLCAKLGDLMSAKALAGGTGPPDHPSGRNRGRGLLPVAGADAQRRGRRLPLGYLRPRDDDLRLAHGATAV